MSHLGSKIVDICQKLGTVNPSLGNFELCVAAKNMVKKGEFVVSDGNHDEYYLSAQGKVFDDIDQGCVDGYIVREYPNGKKEKILARTLF